MHKVKKFKFIFTILLVAITLFFISIFDIILNPDNTIIEKHAQLLVDNNEQFVQIEKYKFENGEQDVNLQELTDNDVEQISQKLNEIGKTYLNIYQLGNLHTPSNLVMSYKNIYSMLEINPEFYSYHEPYTYFCDQVDIVEWNDFSHFFIKDIIGKFPENNDEIMISNYLADLLIKEGLKPYNEDIYYKPASYEELVNSNKYFYFGDVDKVKIVGIINYDLSEFESLKNINWNEYNSNLEKYSAISQNLSYKNKNIYNKIFVNNKFINHLKVNDESTSDDIWQNKIAKTGILVMENTKSGFEKLLHDFKYNQSIMAKSTYSENSDIMIQFTSIFSKIPIIFVILFLIIFILIILSVFLISKFTFSEQDMIELKNKKTKNSYIKKSILLNIILISIGALLLSLISLVFIPKFLMNASLDVDNAILNLFVLGTRQFLVLFLSTIGIGIISYLITIVRIKTTYNDN